MLILLLIANTNVNIDHGSIPAAIPVFKTYIKASYATMGLISSLVFAGLLLGSLVSSYI